MLATGAVPTDANGVTTKMGDDGHVPLGKTTRYTPSAVLVELKPLPITGKPSRTRPLTVFVPGPGGPAGTCGPAAP
jgi:hypothetical protein